MSRAHCLVEVPGLLTVVASLVAEHGLQSAGSVAVAHGLFLHGMRDLPWLGIKPMSPVLQSRSLTTGPPGKSPNDYLLKKMTFIIHAEISWK